MSVYLMINFIFLLVSADFVSGQHDCGAESCSKHGPKIRFPFRLKDRHPDHCGYPGFDLYCSQSSETVMENPFPLKASSINETTFQHSAKFIVKKIDYTYQLITLSKVDGCCFPGLLLQLNLSASPFSFDHLMEFNLFSCPSTRTGYDMYPVPCLSSSDHHVYVASSHLPSYLAPLYSCTKMFAMSSIPSALFDEFFGPLQLNWSKPNCGDCEMEGTQCRLKSNGSIHKIECFSEETVVPDIQVYLAELSKKKIFKGVVIGLLALALVISVLYYIHSFKKKKEDEKRIEQFLENYKALRPTRYTYAYIKKISNNFKEKLGQGGYGTVYKGKLPNDILVAVKVLDNFKGNGEEFVNEVGTIGRIHHVNVVRLVGYCADGCRRALLYEFLQNESLEKLLSSRNQSRSLGWEKLQQIAIGIAKGLDYLHQGCSQRILHFDIKPHNILLDHNFNPKVADFGLAKLCSKEQSIVSMTVARGTIGYIAPEVFSRSYGNVSYKADIYSFGMLLLDMAGGRKNFHAAAKDNSEVYFPEWMYNQLEKGEEISIHIDKEEDNKILKKLTIVGLWCIQWYPIDRPSLKVVIQMLKGDDIPTMPPNPFASTKASASNASVPISRFYGALEIISEGN